MSKQPHIIIFNPDSWRGDVVGHTGNPAAMTPHLDALVADDAVSFRNTFAQNPVCTPSRCSFMTGWYPHVRGHRSMLHMLQPDEPMLLQTLKALGYYVWWGGKNDLAAVTTRADYGRCCDHKNQPQARPTGLRRPAPMVPGDPRHYAFYGGALSAGNSGRDYVDTDGDNVADAIELIRNPPRDRPLCIYLPLIAPHPPYLAPEALLACIDRDRLPPRVLPPAPKHELPVMRRLREVCGTDALDETFWREVQAIYYAMCARVDQLFGQVVAALRETGIYDDSAIFFFSDHGDFTGDYGLPEKTHATLQDCLLHVPMVVKPPRGTPVVPGIRDQLVELIDFPATVEDLVAAKPGHAHFGRSLLPLLAAETVPHRDAVFAEVGAHPGEWQARNTEVQDISPNSIYWPQIQVYNESPAHFSYCAMCRTERYKYIRRLYDTDELYDLAADPDERINLVDDRAQAEVLAQLQQRLLDFYMRTADVIPFDQDSRRI